MSELAQKSRAAMKDKIKRMLGPGSGGDIDASGWREPTDMRTNAQTGLRPVSRQARKRGGKVEGHVPQHRADRKPRKSGGRAIANDYVTRNVKDANASEFGRPHDGGYAHGGAANFRKQMHADVAEDKRLARHMKSSRSHKRNGGGQFIQNAIKHPGALHEELHVPKGQKIPTKKLAKTTRSDNPKLAKRAKFAEELKGFRHAKAHGGSLAAEAGMRPKGGRDAHKRGGRAKGKTNILINISPGHAQQPTPMPAAPVRPPQPAPAPTPAPMPPQIAGGAPPMMGLGAAGPQMPMMRKHGGRTMPTVASAKRARSYKDVDASASAGLGRLEKTAIQEHRR
jgi:hypothetical protein